MDPDEVERLVECQRQSYSLFRWFVSGLENYWLTPHAVRDTAGLPEAAQSWITKHRDSIPSDVRPTDEDMTLVCNVFATYLESSFYVVPNPGQRLYSPDAHCFCPLCSWLVDAPHLKTRKPGSGDKRRARAMKLTCLRHLAIDCNVELTDEQIDTLVDDPDLREACSYVAYYAELKRRASGQPTTTSSLVLWRGFAWTATGAPKKRFKLGAKNIIAARELLCRELQALSNGK